jgi:hypothetical protein
MDLQEGGCSHPKGVRGQLPSGACQSGGAGSRTLPAETDASGQPTRAASYKALERATLARAEKSTIKEVRTILFVDQSGFYLLPTVVRTYAPVDQTPVLQEELSRDHLLRRSALLALKASFT